MKKKGIQESNFTFIKDPIGKFEAQKTRMPVIRCVCGFKILVVPDLKAMNRAIKNHALKHKKACSKKSTDFLTEQVLIVASNLV
jgi:DNA-directed RNA polymerase subunit RPC12/RpoP